jgi:beta-glucosidase
MPARVTTDLPTMSSDGLLFRDLDHDGVLAPYEDWRLPADVRAADLVGRMTLREKVGAMLHGTAFAIGGPMGSIGVGDAYDVERVADLLLGRCLTSVITRLPLPPAAMAEQNNLLQRLAAQRRLGIPVLVSSDPRHHFAAVIGATQGSTGFGRWPEAIGLGAIGDSELMRTFGDVVRRDFRAVGIHMLLGPQADLATSPRWPRADGTFGEDPDLVRTLVGAMVEGLQHGRDGLTERSVAAVVKHWVGYGASRDGFDGHNHYGRFSAFPSGAFDDHVHAFGDALDRQVAAVMPTYNILQGLVIGGEALPETGAGFSAPLVDGLLRSGLGYDGMVLSDWAITRDLSDAAIHGTAEPTPADIAMPWGVEHLDRAARYAACVMAGVDQIGGEDDPEPLLAAVGSGLVPQERIDLAVRRVLTITFRLGLFEDPLADPDRAEEVVAAGFPLGDAAQRRSLTWLTAPEQAPVLEPGASVLLEGVGVDEAVAHGLHPVAEPAQADVAVVRLGAPWQLLHPGHFFGRMQHEGDLDLKDDDPLLHRLLALCREVPTVLVVHLDRPAVLGPLADEALAVVGEYGADDDAVLDVLTGARRAVGRLPFRLHATMADALAQPCDRPRDDLPGRFPVGHGTPHEPRAAD